MNEYMNSVTALFSDLVRTYNKFQLSDHSKASLGKGQDILKNGILLLCQLKSHTKALESLLSDCQDYVNEIEDDLSQKHKNEDFVFHTKNGMLSYIGRDFIEAPTKKVISEHKESTPEESTPERVLINDVGYYMKMPVIKDLKQIPPMFYYYKSSNLDGQGVYCCLGPNVYAKVPFPIIIDSTKEYNRDRSIKCKYKTKALCDDQRAKMAKYHNSQVRICNFAHEGEKLIKVGYPSRCATIPNFGNPQSLANDIKNVDLDGIKTILMYGLNDVALVSIWLDCNKETGIYDKLDEV